MRTLCSAPMVAGPERGRPQRRSAPLALAMHQTCELLIGWRRGAWRRRWLGVGTAWSMCLIGWTGALLLPGHDVAEPGVDRGDYPATTSGAAGGAHAPDRLSPTLQASRDKAASLQTDLTAALALRTARARHLAAVPRALDGDRQRNSIHEQAEVQLHQQGALIAVLESQLAAEQARIATLEQDLAVQSENQVGLADATSDHAPRPEPVAVPSPLAYPAVASPALETARGGGEPTLRRVAEPSRPIGSDSPRLMFLAGTLAVAIAAGAAAAIWRGRRDRIVDDAMQLQRRFGLPVLGSIATAAPAEERRREQVARRNLGLACLCLFGLFGSLVIAEALDLLAPLGRWLRASWGG